MLRHLLENNSDLKIGCIINDVAAINVDAKLIRNDRNRGRSQKLNSTSDLAYTIELANGCACEYGHPLTSWHTLGQDNQQHCLVCLCHLLCAGCSIQDELFASFEQLISLSDKRGQPFDRYRFASCPLLHCRLADFPNTLHQLSTAAWLLHLTRHSLVTIEEPCNNPGLCWRTRAWRNRTRSATDSRTQLLGDSCSCSACGWTPW